MKSKTGFLFILILITNTLNAQDKITGRWTPVRIIMDGYPEGMDIEWAEKSLYAEIKQRADSLGKEIKMDAIDSAEIKASAKEVLNSLFGKIYFRFNPDKTCFWNFGDIMDGTDYEGMNLKGKYKLDESANSIVVTTDKKQAADQKVINMAAEKLTFYYSFNHEQLRLELDDGTVVFYLKRE